MSARFKNSSSIFPLGKCHDNFIKTMTYVNNHNPSLNPVVLTGIVDFLNSRILLLIYIVL